MSIPAGTRLGPYEILSPLGAGGMGEVYRARDARVDRLVALKVLPGDFLEGEEGRARKERFGREARALASLNHPNIAVLHSFEEIPGPSPSSSRHLLTMELVEGATLREKLASGPLRLEEALSYALQMAKGLSAAHEKGIVHRDLKPENLIVTKDGHLKILDFGLAKRTEESKPGEQTSLPTESKHTEPGVVMGTVGYMSPEQVRGLQVDPRSDIFSFGAILYELLSGKKAFKRGTPADTMSAILKEEPPELAESGRNVPPALDRVVKHCLEKDRGNRFQSAKDVAFALSEASGPAPMPSGAQAAARASGRKRTIAVGAAIALLALAGILVLRRPGKPVGPRRLAVLPFENLGASEDEYFADGIADAVRGKLTSLEGIEVIARGSSTPYRKTTKSQKEIARDLDVKYLLTATVRWQKGAGGSRVEVSPELVEVRESGAPSSRWQQSFDAALTDVFQVQSDIATRVAQALGVALGTGEEKRLLERPTRNLAAYDAFLRGEESVKGIEPPTLRRKIGFYEQAVALDPGFALAWARLGATSAVLYGQSTPSPVLAERSLAGAKKALELSPDLPEGYLALGDYYATVQSDFKGALEQLSRGLRLAPAHPQLLAATAEMEMSLGHWEASVDRFRHAMRLDPRTIRPIYGLAQALANLRRFAEARDVLDKSLALNPASLSVIDSKVYTYLGEGDLGGARAVLRAVPKEVDPTALVAYLANYGDLVWILDESQRELLLRLTPSAFDDDRAVWGICLAQACALRGDVAGVRTYAEEARKAFEDQLITAPQNAQRHVLLGLALAYLGRKDEAIREGTRSMDLAPVAKDAGLGPYDQHQLVRIYILLGEHEKALDELEAILKVPYTLSRDWLKIDPNFDPLRKNPRFQKLVAGK